jgi:D-3-phosphoglycerate dehydrogenase
MAKWPLWTTLAGSPQRKEAKVADDLSSAKVLVTPRSFGQSDPNLLITLQERVGDVVYNPYGRALTSQEVSSLIEDCDGYIAGVDVIDSQVIAAASKLKVIARYGVGVDKVDLEAARRNQITVTNTPLANAQSVAELTLGLLLSLLRKIPYATIQTKQGEWPRIEGFSLDGKTVGLIGFGMIGRTFARLLGGFGCRLMSYDPFPNREYAEEVGVELVDLEDLIKRADIVSLHLPLTPDTRNIIDRQMLSSMKTGAYLLNTSRGEIVDEDALVESLRSGHLAGAGLDVLAQEPPADNHPLLMMENVLVTPHSGAHTDGATNAMGWASLEDCLAVLSGQEPKYKVV